MWIPSGAVQLKPPQTMDQRRGWAWSNAMYLLAVWIDVQLPLGVPMIDAVDSLITMCTGGEIKWVGGWEMCVFLLFLSLSPSPCPLFHSPSLRDGLSRLSFKFDQMNHRQMTIAHSTSTGRVRRIFFPFTGKQGKSVSLVSFIVRRMSEQIWRVKCLSQTNRQRDSERGRETGFVARQRKDALLFAWFKFDLLSLVWVKWKWTWWKERQEKEEEDDDEKE